MVQFWLVVRLIRLRIKPGHMGDREKKISVATDAFMETFWVGLKALTLPRLRAHEYSEEAKGRKASRHPIV